MHSEAPNCSKEFPINRVAATYAWGISLTPAIFCVFLALYRDKAWDFGGFQVLANLVTAIGVLVLVIAELRANGLYIALTESTGPIPGHIVKSLVKAASAISSALVLILVGTLGHRELTIFWLVCGASFFIPCKIFKALLSR